MLKLIVLDEEPLFFFPRRRKIIGILTAVNAIRSNKNANPNLNNPCIVERMQVSVIYHQSKVEIEVT